jgi:hypothetical protein
LVKKFVNVYTPADLNPGLRFSSLKYPDSAIYDCVNISTKNTIILFNV